MAKERSRFAHRQQIKFLNEELLEAIRKFKADKTQEVFIYNYHGYLFSQTKKHFEKLGLILKWKKGAEEKDGYWMFILPEFDIDLSKLR